LHSDVCSGISRGWKRVRIGDTKKTMVSTILPFPTGAAGNFFANYRSLSSLKQDDTLKKFAPEERKNGYICCLLPLASRW
jgi:hypothetical protein